MNENIKIYVLDILEQPYIQMLRENETKKLSNHQYLHKLIYFSIL